MMNQASNMQRISRMLVILIVVSVVLAMPVMAENNAAIEAYNRGTQLLNTGQNRESIPYFDQAIRLNPRYAEAYTNRGFAYKNLGQYQRAIQDYSQALSINSRDAGAYNNRGLAYRNLRQYERAIQDYNQALMINPRYAEVYNNRGVVYRNLGQYQRAIQDYNQALTINPRLAEPYYNRGISYLILGKGDVISDVRRVLEIKGWRDDRSLPAVLFGYFGMVQSGRSAEAKRWLNEGTSRCDTSDWLYQIIRYLKGELSEDQLLRLANDKNKLTIAQTYIGFTCYLNSLPGRGATHPDVLAREAAQRFDWVIHNGSKDYIEYVLAQGLRQRIK